MNDKKKPENEGQYMSMGLSLGMSIGISIGLCIGAALHNIPLYMCIGLSTGMGVGVCIGSYIDSKKKKESEDTIDQSEKQDEE